MDISRRTFLAWSAAIGASLPLGQFAPLTAAPVTPRAKAQPTVVFTKPLQWLDYDGVAETAAEAGFNGLDIPVRPGGHVLAERVADDLPRAVEAARKAGLVVPMITTAVAGADQPHTEAILKTASQLGIGYYRLGWLNYRNDWDPAKSVEQYRSVFRDLAQLNGHYRIHGAYQNHAGTRVGAPLWDLWLLVRDLDPRWIGVQYDIRHATVEGGQSWPLGLRLLTSHIRTTDIKDFVWDKGANGKWLPRTVPLGEGMVDFPAYFKLVRELGIGGPTSVHFEYPPLEGKSDLPAPARRRQAVELMRKDLGRLRAMRTAAGL